MTTLELLMMPGMTSSINTEIYRKQREESQKQMLNSMLLRRISYQLMGLKGKTLK